MNQGRTNISGILHFLGVVFFAVTLAFVSVTASYAAQVTTTSDTSTSTGSGPYNTTTTNTSTTSTTSTSSGGSNTTTTTGTTYTSGPSFPALNSSAGAGGHVSNQGSYTFGTPNVPAGASPTVIKGHKELFNIPFKIEEKATLRELVRRHDSILDLMCFADQLMIFSFAGTLFSDLQFNFIIPSWETLLCSAIEFFFGGSLAAALEALFNLPFGLPPVCLQGPSFNIGAEIGAAFQAMLTGGILGCVINATIDLAGNLAVGMSFDPGCLVSIDICSGINDLAGISICQRCNKSAEFWNKVGGSLSDEVASIFAGDSVDVVPVEGSGINRGAPYMTHGELLKVSENAKAYANAAIAAAIQPTGELSVGVDFNSDCNLDGCTSSGDGFTAGGNFNPGIGFNATAGYKIDFMGELGNELNQPWMQQAVGCGYSSPGVGFGDQQGQGGSGQEFNCGKTSPQGGATSVPSFGKYAKRQKIIQMMNP